jgi:hypothetical protein
MIFVQVLQRSPEHGSARLDLALTLTQLGKDQAAREALPSTSGATQHTHSAGSSRPETQIPARTSTPLLSWPHQATKRHLGLY